MIWTSIHKKINVSRILGNMTFNNVHFSDPQEIVDSFDPFLFLFLNLYLFQQTQIPSNSNTIIHGLCNTQTNISFQQISEIIVFRKI